MTMNITRQSLPETAALTRLGVGGEGIIYDLSTTDVPQKIQEAAGGRPVVYKEFLHADSPAEAQHHRAVVDFLGKLGTDQRAWLLDRAAWPLAVVTDSGSVTGIVMPRIPDQFFRDFPTPSGGSIRKEADFQMLLNDRKFLEARSIGIGKKRKLGILIQVAELLRVLQGSGLVVGDLSAKNLLFSLEDGPDYPGSVYLIDCDSVSTPGGANLSGMETPGWSLPEGEKTQTQEGDRYKFALLVLRVLAGNQMTRDLTDLPSSTPEHIKLMMRRSLSTEPPVRSRFQEWVEVLQAAQAEVATQPLKVVSISATQPRVPASGAPAAPVVGRRKPPEVAPEPEQPSVPESSNSSTGDDGDDDALAYGGCVGCAVFLIVIAVVVGMFLKWIPKPWGGDDESSPTIDASWCTSEDESAVRDSLKSTYPGAGWYVPPCPTYISANGDDGYVVAFGGDHIPLPEASDGVVRENDLEREIGDSRYLLLAAALLESSDDIGSYLPITDSTLESIETTWRNRHPYLTD